MVLPAVFFQDGWRIRQCRRKAHTAGDRREAPSGRRAGVARPVGGREAAQRAARKAPPASRRDIPCLASCCLRQGQSLPCAEEPPIVAGKLTGKARGIPFAGFDERAGCAASKARAGFQGPPTLSGCVPVPNPAAAGLPAPSIIRCARVATTDAETEPRWGVHPALSAGLPPSNAGAGRHDRPEAPTDRPENVSDLSRLPPAENPGSLQARRRRPGPWRGAHPRRPARASAPKGRGSGVSRPAGRRKVRPARRRPKPRLP